VTPGGRAANTTGVAISLPARPGRHLTDAEALMWSLDDDPTMRSSFVGITFLDRPPDAERLRRRMSEAVATTESLRQRVVPSPFGLPPRWAPDPGFDLDYHLRRVALPAPGTRRQLLDLGALLSTDPLDRARPLWQFTVVEGLQGGGAALLAKMHHVLSDGVGAIRISVSFLDLTPDGRPGPSTRSARRGRGRRKGAQLPSSPPTGPPSGRGLLDSASHAVTDALSSLVRAPVEGLSLGVSTARSLGRQLGVIDPARSPLWSGRSSLSHRFDTASVDLDRTRAVARALGGTVNDAFVTIMAGAAGAYHRSLGVDVDELRMSMPISVRTDKRAAGNAWVPARVLVPTGDLDPAARFAEVSARLAAVKRERSLDFAEAFAGVVRHLPSPILLRLAHQQVHTVDFACSNVRGAPFDLWIAGAHVEGNHPMGPTVGVAFNATVLSYRDSLDLGLNSDAGAVTEPDRLRSCVEDAAAELTALA